MERKFIDQAKGLYKEDLTPESMIFYLKDAGAIPEQIPGILDEAWTEFVNERTAKYKVVNKVIFYLNLTLILLAMVVFLGFLPGKNFVIGNVFVFSALGAILVCVFSFYALAYNNTWKSPFVEKYGKPKIQYAFFIIIPLPIVIMHFIFSARFDNAQDAVLKETQVETTARVVYGRSVAIKQVLRSGQANFASITVIFKPEQSDDSVIVTKDIPASQFKDFYEGEELRIIYSKTNPQNISLLTNDETVRSFKQTEQRELEIYDLLKLATVDPDKFSTELNKISFGWTYEKKKNIYVNEHFQNELSQRGAALLFVGPTENRRLFADSLKTKGFKQSSKDEPTDIFGTGPVTFENDKFKVDLTVLSGNKDDGGASGPGPALVIITRKQ